MESPIYFHCVAWYAQLYSLYVTQRMLNVIQSTFIEWREAAVGSDSICSNEWMDYNSEL